MNTHDECVKIVHEMESHGWKLVDQTADEYVSEYEKVDGLDVLDFFKNMLENVKNWRK